MSKVQDTVTRAFTMLEEICGVLESGTDPKSRAVALRAWRTEQATRLRDLTAEIRQFSLAELTPVLNAEKAHHPRAGKAIDLAMASHDDPEFAAEWKAVSDMLGGSGQG